MDSRVAKRYARALFGAAEKADIIAAVEADLDGISAFLEHDPKNAKFLLAPDYSREQKLKVLEKIFSDRITALSMQLIRLLLEKRREAELPLIREEFVVLRRMRDRVIYAEITSANPLDDVQVAAIVAKLESQSGKRVEATTHVDPKVMGGVKVAYDNYVLDGTVLGSLARLREKLLYDVLKQN